MLINRKIIVAKSMLGLLFGLIASMVVVSNYGSEIFSESGNDEKLFFILIVLICLYAPVLATMFFSLLYGRLFRQILQVLIDDDEVEVHRTFEFILTRFIAPLFVILVMMISVFTYFFFSFFIFQITVICLALPIGIFAGLARAFVIDRGFSTLTLAGLKGQLIAFLIIGVIFFLLWIANIFSYLFAPFLVLALTLLSASICYSIAVEEEKYTNN